MSEGGGRVAIDIDLGRFTVVVENGPVLAHGVDPLSDDAPLELPENVDTVLIEVAGPIMHHEESHSHRRWMIYNAMMAVSVMGGYRMPWMNFLFASSTAWTNGFPEAERHAIAGMNPLKYRKAVKGRKPVPIYAEAHDIRECRAMLDFFRKCPKHWKPLDQYLKELVK